MRTFKWISKALLLSAMLLGTAEAAQKLDKIVLAGPAATVSHPLLRMIESGALNDIANKVEFKLWNNPDQLRAMIINKEVDFVAVPTNVGSILYNKKQSIKLLNVSIWGILKILTTDEKITKLEDLKGSEVLIPWRGDMPDIVLRTIMKKKGLTKKDIKLSYVSNPMDAAQQLIKRNADNILLPEPAGSMVLRKTKSFPISVIAPNTFIGIDLQTEWGSAFGRDPKIAQAGMAIVGDMLEKKEIIKRFSQAYNEASDWYTTHPKEAAKIVAKYVKMFNEEAIADSITRVQLKVVPAKEAKEEIEFFFGKLMENDPKIIGGSIPDENFYFKD
jgi:NitT/TauT family transport system substrate-binding protein